MLIRRLSALLASAALTVTGGWFPAQSAAQSLVVSPGMPILQTSGMCTVGWVDPEHRLAFTAGHCRGSGVAGDESGQFVGRTLLWRNNVDGGSTIDQARFMADYEVIGLAPGVVSHRVLPDGHTLAVVDDVHLGVRQQVCVFGATSGRSCGTVTELNNGWFTMGGDLRVAEGDSGGPVYVVRSDGTAVLVGLLVAVWGTRPAAVTWQSVMTQVIFDVGLAMQNGIRNGHR